MSKQFQLSLYWLLSCLVALSVSSLSLAQEDSATWQAKRTEFGHPDLQGYWNNSSRSPLQRPESLGNKKIYTAEEARQVELGAQLEDQEKAAPIDPDRDAPEEGGSIQFQADENFANTRLSLTRINGEYRTSKIVEPANGRLPYVENVFQEDIFGEWMAAGNGALDGPEMRSQMERCIHVGTQMPPMFDWTYNANFQIVQTPQYVVILSEMIHDARIIRLQDEHQPAVFQKWFGDSVARWEGDTLVVDSRDFHPQQSNFFMRSSDQFQVTEWFTPVSATEIFYRYRVIDPVIYTEPVVVEMMLNRKPEGEVIYEFACHEGNYSLPSILAGARRQEIESGE